MMRLLAILLDKLRGMIVLDNLIIVSLGGLAVCGIFVVAELVAKYFDWK